MNIIRGCNVIAFVTIGSRPTDSRDEPSIYNFSEFFQIDRSLFSSKIFVDISWFANGFTKIIFDILKFGLIFFFFVSARVMWAEILDFPEHSIYTFYIKLCLELNFLSKILIFWFNTNIKRKIVHFQTKRLKRIFFGKKVWAPIGLKTFIRIIDWGPRHGCLSIDSRSSGKLTAHLHQRLVNYHFHKHIFCFFCMFVWIKLDYRTRQYECEGALLSSLGLQ